jgi:iron complex outermembrane receptor protein
MSSGLNHIYANIFIMKTFKNKQMALKPGVLALAMAFAAPQWVQAQQAPADAPIQKVTVTGSNIKRVAIEGASPITVITAKEIKATGANSISELLHSIPAFGSGSTLDTTDGGFARGTSTASLRGLGPSSTLVLLNGRRITASAYADPNQGRSTVYDLNTLPISAIERIEILKEGASAVYGSDAIAGVVNFITKENYQGAEVSGGYSANDDNRFGTKRGSAFWGFGDLATQGYNVWVSLDLLDRDSTKIKDVRDIHTAQLADVNARLNEFSSSLTDQPFFYRERTPGARNFANTFALRADVINRTNCDPASKLVGSRDKHNLTATDTLVGRTFCNFNLDDFSEAQSYGKDTNLLSRGTFKLGGTTTAFTEVMYTRSEREYLAAPRAFRSTASTTTFSLNGPPSQFQVILPIGHPDNPFTAANGFTPSRAAVGLRFVNTDGSSANVNESYRVLAGLKGSVSKWDWETAVMWNRSERHETTNGLLYRPTLEKIFTQNRTLAETLADPTATRTANNAGFAQISQWDGKVSTEFGKLGGGAIGMAAGAEYRQEKIGLTPDDVTQRGDIVGLANSLADGRRNIKSAFVEFHTPFTKTLEMDFAARYDKYPTYKGSTVPSVRLKWTPSAKFAFRASYAEGFRAPALTQVSPGGVQSFSTVVDSLRCPDGVNPAPGADRTDCAKGISSLSSANPNLQPEKAKNYNFGFIFEAAKDLNFVVDYFRIEKRLETVLQGAQFVIDHQDQFPGLVLRDNNPANLLVDANGRVIPNSGPISAVNRTYINQGSTEVRGIDVEMTHKKLLGDKGKLDTRLDLQYLLSYKRAEIQGDARLNVAGDAGGIADWATSSGDQPRIRARLATTWTRGVHALTGSVNYVDSVSLLRRTENRDVYPVPYCHYGVGQPSTAYQLGGLPKYSNWQSDCTVGSWTTFGLNYAYTGIKNTTLTLNIQNLFDTAAPYDPRYAAGGFNSQLHNGFGRYFQIGANYKFY